MEKQVNESVTLELCNKGYQLGAGLRVFYEEDVPYLDVYTRDYLHGHDSGVKVPVEALVKWLAANVDAAKEYRKTFVK